MALASDLGLDRDSHEYRKSAMAFDNASSELAESWGRLPWIALGYLLWKKWPPNEIVPGWSTKLARKSGAQILRLLRQAGKYRPPGGQGKAKRKTARGFSLRTSQVRQRKPKKKKKKPVAVKPKPAPRRPPPPSQHFI